MRKLYEIVKFLWIQKKIVAAATIWGKRDIYSLPFQCLWRNFELWHYFCHLFQLLIDWKLYPLVQENPWLKIKYMYLSKYQNVNIHKFISFIRNIAPFCLIIELIIIITNKKENYYYLKGLIDKGRFFRNLELQSSAIYRQLLSIVPKLFEYQIHSHSYLLKILCFEC